MFSVLRSLKHVCRPLELLLGEWLEASHADSLPAAGLSCFGIHGTFAARAIADRAGLALDSRDAASDECQAQRRPISITWARDPNPERYNMDSVAPQAPLATAEELGAAHEAAFVERFLGGDVTAPDMRAIGLPWSPSLATYCRCGVASAGNH